MEENTTRDDTQQTPVQQPITERKAGLMPGQDHEDELDYLGAAIFGFVKKGFNWIKNLIQTQKTG